MRFNSFMSIDSCQFISFHFISFLSNSPWIPISHIYLSKLPPRHVPGTTWYHIVMNDQELSIMWLKNAINHPAVISSSIGAMFTIPSHGWFPESWGSPKSNHLLYLFKWDFPLQTIYFGDLTMIIWKMTWSAQGPAQPVSPPPTLQKCSFGEVMPKTSEKGWCWMMVVKMMMVMIMMMIINRIWSHLWLTFDHAQNCC